MNKKVGNKVEIGEKLLDLYANDEEKLKLAEDMLKNAFVIVDEPAEPGKISELFVECDNREVCRYRADGILVATSNGSTAYSMSAGGPILDTNLSALIMTPVCPHSLISCSIVFSPEKVISIGSSFNGGEKELDIVVDGEIVGKLKKDEKVNVMISEKNIRFVNITNRGFYEVLNQKILSLRV